MHRASFIQKILPSCPVCRASDFSTYRRLPGEGAGYVLHQAACRRCGLSFTIEEDKRGRWVRK